MGLIIDYFLVSGHENLWCQAKKASPKSTCLKSMTRYRIRYRCQYITFSSKAGASVPRPPSIDSNEDREMDFDNHRDYMDQDIPGISCWAVPYCPIWTDFTILEWYARLDEHDSSLQKTSTWQWRASPILRKDVFYLEHHCRRP